MSSIKYTIKDFHKEYPDDDACLHKIFMLKYGDLASCLKCKRLTTFHRIKKKKVYSCKFCGHQMSPLAGTIFHKSPTPLTLWFHAIFLFSCSKNGVSAKELERQLGVTYKTAWRMAKQIRLLFSQGSSVLSGTVEVDETYVGGKGRNNKRGRGAENKTPVVGLVERQGRVKAVVTKDTKSSTVTPIVRETVQIGTDLMTDEYNIYNKMGSYGYNHNRTCHSCGEYVRDKVHTNTIEGFWSQLKRSIDGTYHSVSPKYLQQYVNEFAWRYNYRHLQSNFFTTLIRRVV